MLDHTWILVWHNVTALVQGFETTGCERVVPDQTVISELNQTQFVPEVFSYRFGGTGLIVNRCALGCQVVVEISSQLALQTSPVGLQKFT